MLLSQAVLKMSVRLEIARGPRCFRCKFEMWSGPSAFEFLRLFMMSMVSAGEKGGSVFSGFSFFSRLMIFLLSGWVGWWLVLEKCAIMMLHCVLGLGIWLLCVLIDSWVGGGWV